VLREQLVGHLVHCGEHMGHDNLGAQAAAVAAALRAARRVEWAQRADASCAVDRLRRAYIAGVRQRFFILDLELDVRARVALAGAFELRLDGLVEMVVLQTARRRKARCVGGADAI
jgi:hypothetical protein